MDDKGLFRERTQRHITYLLIYGLLSLIAGLIVASFLPWGVNDKLISMASPLVTGVLSLASGAIGFWIGANHAANTAAPGGNGSPDSPLDQSITPEKTP